MGKLVSLVVWAEKHGWSYAFAKKANREGKLPVVPGGTPNKPKSLIDEDYVHVNPPRQRYPHSAETKAKLSRAHSGKTLSKEHKQAITNGLMGHVHSDETKHKMSATWQSKTKEELRLINVKAELTSMEKYGVQHPSQHPDIAQKIYDTSVRHYGMHHTKTDEVKAKQKTTSEANHGGVYHTKTDAVKAKQMATNLAKYGVKHTMGIARKAFEDTHGGNPFSVQWVKDIIKESNMKKYGVDHYSKTVEYRNKVIASSRERYGVDSVSQRNIDPESLAVLHNKDALEKMITDMPISTISVILGVNPTTVARYADKHEIDRPRSSLGNFVVNILRENNISFVLNDRAILRELHEQRRRGGKRSPLELDMYLPEHNLAIEVCGVYWHSEIWLDRTYHQRKLQMCEAKGIRLLTIFEDEILLDPVITRKRIEHSVGLSEKGSAARKLTIYRIASSVAKEFYDTHHTQKGKAIGNTHYGAYDGGVLVGAMSFGSTRIHMGGDGSTIELIRFATDGKTHAGLAARLFDAYVKEFSPSLIISYADRRWSQGNVYRALGFTLANVSRPNYQYVAPDGRRLHRYQFRKGRITHLVENGENKTEHEIMLEIGYLRIYDCGNLRFEWRP